MTDETMREGLARALCCAAAGDHNPLPVPDDLMPRSWASECGQWRAAADAALSYLASRGGDVGGLVTGLKRSAKSLEIDICGLEHDEDAALNIASARMRKAADALTAQAAALKKVTAERDALREAAQRKINADDALMVAGSIGGGPTYGSAIVERNAADEAFRAALSRRTTEIREAGDDES